MAKAYWVATYRSISNPEALAGYAKLAGPAIQAAGGRFLARGTAAKAYEAGVVQRVVIVQFDSVAKAEAAHDSAAYQEALKNALHDANNNKLSESTTRTLASSAIQTITLTYKYDLQNRLIETIDPRQDETGE